MKNKNGIRPWQVASITAVICLVVGNGAWSDETAKGASQTESETDTSSKTEHNSQSEDAPPAEPDPAPSPTPVPAAQSPVAQDTTASDATAQNFEPEAHPLANLRRLPRKLRPIEGELPPAGYIEVETRKRGLIISGSVVFGSVYLACVIASMADRMLLIPLVGPMIAGYTDEDSDGDEFDDYSEDEKYAGRLMGTLGTIAQVTGVTLFIIGMASKQKTWLRRDIAGLKFQLTPTLVGHNDPGIGIFGTF